MRRRAGGGVKDDAVVPERTNTPTSRPALLCYDGSEDAKVAITRAGDLLAPRGAVVLTVWEPLAVWEPYDPATVLSAPVGKLASYALGLDQVAKEIAQEKVEQAVALAQMAGFSAHGQVTSGKAWRAICDVANEIDADPIVLGARGISRVGSVLLGSVSMAVAVHARRAVLIIPHGPD
jgi:nucleotide-binding universal stress UspA family protein